MSSSPIFDSTVLELCESVISLAAPNASTDDYGNQTYQSPIQYYAHVEYEPKEIRTITGEQVVARAIVMVAPVLYLPGQEPYYLEAPPSISTNYEITLPDGSKPLILSYEINRSPSLGLDHIVVYC